VEVRKMNIQESKAEKNIRELKELIQEGNRETDKLHLPSKSAALYEEYYNKLLRKVEEITGEKIDFCYYSF
jgi:hypothetical protein